MNIVGFFLPNPKDLVGGGLDGGTTESDGREFFLEIVAGTNAELFDGVGGSAILPMGADFFATRVSTMGKNILAHFYELFVGFAHKTPLRIL